MRTYIIYFLCVYRIPYYLIFCTSLRFGMVRVSKASKIAGQLAGLVAWGLFLGKPASFHSSFRIKLMCVSDRAASVRNQPTKHVSILSMNPWIHLSLLCLLFSGKGSWKHLETRIIFGGCFNIQFPKRINKKVVFFFWNLLTQHVSFALEDKIISVSAAVWESFPIGWLDDISVQVQLVGWKLVGKRSMN